VAMVTVYLGLFQKKILRGGRQVGNGFLSAGWGCLEAKCVRRVEEMNGRCPGGGGVDTALG